MAAVQAQASLRILGIDPGSITTGFGVIELDRQGRLRYVASGCIRLRGIHMSQRLHGLFAQLSELIDEFHPHEAGIERVFVQRNIASALKLGQARGVALCALAQAALPIGEYAAREVKLAVVGHGSASKLQVQHMIISLLSLSGRPQADAADALAVAVCHAHVHRQPLQRQAANGASHT